MIFSVGSLPAWLETAGSLGLEIAVELWNCLVLLRCGVNRMTRLSSPRVSLVKFHFSPGRHGLTLTELLVTTAIVSVLMALIVPGVMNARASARRLECLNHVKQLAMAEINYEQGHASVLPLEDGNVSGNWIFHLLPYLDQAALQRHLTASMHAGGGPVSGNAPDSSHDPDSGTAGAGLPHLAVLTCPVDEFHFQVSAGLSYVANAGYMRDGYWGVVDDTDHSLEVYTSANPGWSEQVTQSTGIFFRSNLGRNRLMPQFFDGRAQTILFTENLQAGRYDSRYTGDLGFGVDCTYPPVPDGPPAPDILALGTMLFCSSDSTINAKVDQAIPGECPRPSSHHAQGVNVAFADGGGRFLSEDINDVVYFRLVSSSGSRYGQRLVSDSSF